MANQKISQMPSLTASELAAGDLLAVVDVSDVTQASSGSNKKITVTDLQSAAVSAGTANGVLYLNGSKVATSGSALTFDGTNLGLGTTIDTQRKVNILSGAGQSPLVAVGQSAYLLVDNAGSGENYFQANSANIWQGTGGSEQMRLTSTGLGIGTPTPSQRIDAVTSGGSSYLRNYNGTIESFSGVSEAVGGAVYGTGNNYPVTFFTNGAERARIDSSGNLLIGTTSNPGGGFGSESFVVNKERNAALLRTTSTADVGVALSCARVSDGFQISFHQSGSYIGSISTNGTATAYNTSSDYRLKNIIRPVQNSGAYIDSLNPVEGTWKADGSTFVGLIAHEVQEVSRTQVATGEKDGAKMQAMDYSNSELIANLIAEVKSLRARVAALESN